MAMRTIRMLEKVMQVEVRSRERKKDVQEKERCPTKVYECRDERMSE